MSAPLSRTSQAARRKSHNARGKQKPSRFRRPMLELLEDRRLLAVSPPLLSTIEGFNSDDNAFNAGMPVPVIEPPDPSGAVGPQHVLNAGNVSIQWFLKDGTPQYQSSLRNFFAPLRPIPNALIFDPKVVYDQYAERFVVVALEQMTLGQGGGTANVSRIVLAVSDDSDPNGTWKHHSINGMFNLPSPLDPVTILPHWTDYPGLAIDRDAIYITGNLFSFGTNVANSSRLWIVDKGLGRGGFYDMGPAAVQLYDPAAITNLNPTVIAGYNPNFPQIFRGLTPAHIFGQAPGNVGTWLVAYDGHTNGIDEFVDIIRVDNPLGTPTFTLTTVNVGDIDNTVDHPIVPFVPQRTGLPIIDGGDRRVINAVWRNNSLYVSTVVVPGFGEDVNEVTAHWFRFNATATTVSLADQGDVGGSEIAFATHTSWPSVMVDSQDNMAIGFAASGPAIYPGAYYAVRAASDPPGTMRDARVIAEGQDVYLGQRWGDYSSVALDPADNVTFWAYNQYSLPNQLVNRWGTRWGEFRLADLPPLPAPGPTTITGLKWHDLDDDGFRDPGEPGIAGTLIYVDLDGDGQLDLGEPSARTNAFGVYSITINVDGPVMIRESIPPGWRQTFPGGDTPFHVVNIPAGGGGTISGINFGNSNNFGFDWGDAPAPYPTLSINNGASHPINPAIMLGTLIDGEPDGQPDIDALGDDNNGLDDEDGVILPQSLAPGSLTTIQVTTTGTGFLQGWIDFNRDGDWNDLGEQIFRDVSLSTGTRSLSFVVPSNAVPGTTFARFRYSTQGGLGPTGASNRDGEVEDYKIDILSDRPIANNDFFTVEQNSTDNVFLVLANDIASASGRANMRLDSVNTAGSSGTAVIDRNGTPTDLTDDFIRYTPAPGAFAPDAFTYTIVDVVSGQSASATVSVTIVPFAGNFPVAVDDSFIYTPEGPGLNFDDLNVLANDQRGPTGTIVIPPNGLDTTNTFGTVQLVTVSGQQQVRYTPGGFTGTDQFRYTIVDAANIASTATVTIRVAPHTQDDIVKVRLETTDLNGNPIATIGQGLEFQVRAYVDDVRGEPGRPPLNNPDYPVSSPQDQGVFSAYMDLLYDAGLVAYSGDAKLSFGPQYPAGQFVDSAIPGILNEVGAFQGVGSSPLGPNEQLLYAATFTATALGTVSFRADPADVLPLHDTVVNIPEKAVDFQRIDYGIASVQVVEAPTLAQIRLTATDLNGNPLPNNQIQAGNDFLVNAWVQDVRMNVPDDQKGVFSAYLDVFYPQTLARPVASTTSPFGFVINFGPLFTEVQKAEFIVASGIINEVGAVQGGSPQLFAGEQRLFSARFTALSPPGGLGSLAFTADPADLQPVNEVSLIRAATGQIPDPGLSVPTAQIAYIPTPVITVIGAVGEGEFTNPYNRLDVNNDGYVSPIDALILTNFLNHTGPIDLKTLDFSQGEGEDASADRYYYDVNGDKLISPLDVVTLINHLNAAAAGGAGEGESLPELGDVTIVAQRMDLSTAAQIVAAIPLGSTAAQTSADQVLPEDLWDLALRESPVQAEAVADEVLGWDGLLADDLLEDISGAWLGLGEAEELLVPLV